MGYLPGDASTPCIEPWNSPRRYVRSEQLWCANQAILPLLGTWELLRRCAHSQKPCALGGGTSGPNDVAISHDGTSALSNCGILGRVATASWCNGIFVTWNRTIDVNQQTSRYISLVEIPINSTFSRSVETRVFQLQI